MHVKSIKTFKILLERIFNGLDSLQGPQCLFYVTRSRSFYSNLGWRFRHAICLCLSASAVLYLNLKAVHCTPIHRAAQALPSFERPRSWHGRHYRHPCPTSGPPAQTGPAPPLCADHRRRVLSQATPCLSPPRRRSSSGSATRGCEKGRLQRVRQQARPAVGPQQQRTQRPGPPPSSPVNWGGGGGANPDPISKASLLVIFVLVPFHQFLATRFVVPSMYRLNFKRAIHASACIDWFTSSSSAPLLCSATPEDDLTHNFNNNKHNMNKKTAKYLIF